jgi:hypothetical protein
MKIVLIYIFLFTCSISFSQVALDTNCIREKPRPLWSASDWEVEVDTISEDIFQTILDTLYSDMSKKTLSKAEERGIIKVLNTSFWAPDDGQEEKLRKFPKVKLIEKLYDDFYEKALYCRYKTGSGPGFSFCYDDLKICWAGIPSACPRFIIK